MDKKEKKNLIVGVGVGVLVLILLFIAVKIFSSGESILPEEEPKVLTEVLIEAGDYKIGKINEAYDICHVSSGCLLGEALAIKNDGEDIYLFYDFESDKGSKGYGDDLTIEYRYCIYSNDDCVMVDDLNTIPELLILRNNELLMYSKKDIDTLLEGEKEIFKELEESYVLGETKGIMEDYKTETGSGSININLDNIQSSQNNEAGSGITINLDDLLE